MITTKPRRTKRMYSKTITQDYKSPKGSEQFQRSEANTFHHIRPKKPSQTISRVQFNCTTVLERKKSCTHILVLASMTIDPSRCPTALRASTKTSSHASSLASNPSSPSSLRIPSPQHTPRRCRCRRHIQSQCQYRSVNHCCLR